MKSFPLTLVTFVSVCRAFGRTEVAAGLNRLEDLTSREREVPELIEYWGYECESHSVTTADGYILTVHRIPPANRGRVEDDLSFEDEAAYNATTKSESLTSETKPSSPRVFLLHGLFGTSARWTLGPPDKVLLLF